MLGLKPTSFLTTRTPNHGLKRTEKNKKKAVAKGRHTVKFFLGTCVLENFQKSRKNSRKNFKKMGTPKVCSLLHGVFMGVYLFEMLTLCSPKFQGRYYRFPSFLPWVPLLLQGFQPIF